MINIKTLGCNAVHYICLYEDECIFIHEESEICKFGKGCDRILCMFKHETCEHDDDEEADESEDESESESEDLNNEELKPVLGKLE